MSNPSMNKCDICCSKVHSHNLKLTCCLCKQLYHVKCLPVFTRDDYNYANNPMNFWSCVNCNESIFPFNKLEDSDFCRSSMFHEQFLSMSDIEDKLFNPFDFEVLESEDPLTDIDPDLNYFNALSNSSLQNSDYFTNASFQKYIDKNNVTNNCLSLIHTNIRSLNKNISELTTYLNTLPIEFTCIGLTETWLKDFNADCLNIKGYNHIYKYREQRTGGGTSIFLKDNIPFIEREDLCALNECYESLFIEGNKNCFQTDSNIIIGVIYRIPGTDVNVFNEYFNDVLCKIKNEKKLGYYLGDYNINLLNADDHSPTTDFVDIILSNSCIPLITRPTRISPTSSTLIDNIFTNNFKENDCLKGIFINDITDHFPIFCINIKHTYTAYTFFCTSGNTLLKILQSLEMN